jgi:hypothetical protein
MPASGTAGWSKGVAVAVWELMGCDEMCGELGGKGCWACDGSRAGNEVQFVLMWGNTQCDPVRRWDEAPALVGSNGALGLAKRDGGPDAGQVIMPG